MREEAGTKGEIYRVGDKKEQGRGFRCQPGETSYSTWKYHLLLSHIKKKRRETGLSDKMKA